MSGPTSAGAAAALRREDWVVIGVSGVTCGGKTTLANRLRSSLWPSHVFHQDRYFLPADSPAHTPAAGLAHHNYDVLTALDMRAMAADVRAVAEARGRAHEDNLSSAPPPFPTNGKTFLILEGFTVLNYEPLNDLCDLRYYFVLEYSECLARRVFRLYDPPDVDGYFDQCVWPQHCTYRREIEKDKRVMFVDGTRQDTFDMVMEHIREFCAK